MLANTTISWALTQKIIYFLGWVKIIIADLLFMIIYSVFDYLFEYTYLLGWVKKIILHTCSPFIIFDNLQPI
jgi:F0F1-type ATP synthase assembly protein I